MPKKNYLKEKPVIVRNPRNQSPAPELYTAGKSTMNLKISKNSIETDCLRKSIFKNP